MGGSLTDEESQGSECGSCDADCSQGQTVDTRPTDLDMNSFHDTTLPEISEEDATWEDRPIRPYLNSLDASARNAIVSAARSSRPVVLDYCYINHSLVAETNEAVFVYDKARDKVTRGRYHGGRRPSSDDSFHSPAVIPPSALDKPSIMKRYHRRRTTR